MLNHIKPDDIGNWVCIYETSVDYDASLVQGYLSDQNIPCQILSKKDSAYRTNYGHLSLIFLYVPADFEEEARDAMKIWEEAGSVQGNDNDES